MGLTYRYPRSRRGIEGLNLRLARGSFTVIAGESGAGKTTLLRALLGLVPRDAGEIRWGGIPVTDPARTFLPPRAAYIAQASTARRWTLEQAMAALLAGNELWVLDDLSSTLGLREERALWDWVFCRFLFWGQGACLIVSNRRPALCRADHILVLEQGKVVGEGQLEELLQSCTEMRRIWATDP
jgi:ATP-binding cassette subfamily B protein